MLKIKTSLYYLEKLIGIEKLGEEIAQSDYLPEEFANIKPPNPSDEVLKKVI